MKTITGHLTATNKRHIKVMIDRGLSEAKINRITYYLSLQDGIYTARIGKVEARTIGESPKMYWDLVTFKI
jgi:hypothetical protein